MATDHANDMDRPDTLTPKPTHLKRDINLQTKVSDNNRVIKTLPRGVRMPDKQDDITEEILMLAWAITAKHLTRGEKDVTRIVADAILQERLRWEDRLHQLQQG